MNKAPWWIEYVPARDDAEYVVRAEGEKAKDLSAAIRLWPQPLVPKGVIHEWRPGEGWGENATPDVCMVWLTQSELERFCPHIAAMAGVFGCGIHDRLEIWDKSNAENSPE